MTLAMAVQLLAALIGASPKIIALIEEMRKSGANEATILTPEQRAIVREALRTVATTVPGGPDNPVVDAMLRA